MNLYVLGVLVQIVLPSLRFSNLDSSYNLDFVTEILCYDKYKSDVVGHEVSM